MRSGILAAGGAVDRALAAHPRLGLVTWSVGGGTLIALFLIRVASGAEFAFVSLALLAAATWIAGDRVSDREFPTSWVPWFNGLVHAVMYALLATLAAALREQPRREQELAPLPGTR